MYCGHEHLTLEGNFYVCMVCGSSFEVSEVFEESIAVCVNCNTKFIQERDLQICDSCIEDFDTDKLWQDHDAGLIDALDFNENKAVREKYRKQY